MTRDDTMAGALPSAAPCFLVGGARLGCTTSPKEVEARSSGWSSSGWGACTGLGGLRDWGAASVAAAAVGVAVVKVTQAVAVD